MLKNKFLFLLLFFILLSCQKIEILEDISFDYNELSKITINAEIKNVLNLYEPSFSEPYIDHSLILPPKFYLNKWINSNINIFGTENNILINILEASVKKSEIINIDKKKYEEKTIFLFEVNFLVEFILYDDSNLILAKTLVETNRTTTSAKYISIQENEKIIKTIIYDSLVDFSIKAKELIEFHMKKFIL